MPAESKLDTGARTARNRFQILVKSEKKVEPRLPTHRIKTSTIIDKMPLIVFVVLSCKS